MIAHHIFYIGICSTLFFITTGEARRSKSKKHSLNIHESDGQNGKTMETVELQTNKTNVVSPEKDDESADEHVSSSSRTYDAATRTRRKRYRRLYTPIKQESNVKKLFFSGTNPNSAFIMFASLLVTGAVAAATLQYLKKDTELPNVVQVAMGLPKSVSTDNAATEIEKSSVASAALALASSKFFLVPLGLLTAYALRGMAFEVLLYGLGYLAVEAIILIGAQLKNWKGKMEKKTGDRYDRLADVLIMMAPQDEKERSILKTRCMQALQFLALVEDQKQRTKWKVHRVELREFRFGAYAIAQWLGTAARAMRLASNQKKEVKDDLIQIPRLHDALIKAARVEPRPQVDEFLVPPYPVDNNGNEIIPTINRKDLLCLVQIISRVSEKL